MTRLPDHRAFTQASEQAPVRRDVGPHTPPFTLTDADVARLVEVEAMCRRHGSNPLASITLELEHMSRAHYYLHRPIVGLSRSLDGVGFAEDWAANRAAHMAEAFAAWDLASVELGIAA